MYNSPFLNPFAPYAQMPQNMAQNMAQIQVVKVSGEPGARAYQIGPNSSALLLDESGLMVWLVTTDGAGYKTVSPYDITPHQAAPAPDYSTLEQRIAKLEGFMNEFTDDSPTAGKHAGKPATD